MNRVPNTQKVLLKDFLSPVLCILLLLQTANKSIFNLTNKQSYINSWETTFAEALILWPPDVKSRLIGKDPDAGNDWGQEEKGVTEDEMVGWHHWLNGHEFRDGEGQGSLACCSPQGHKDSDMTQQLNNNNTSYIILIKRKKKSSSAYSGKADTTPMANAADDVKNLYIETEPTNTLQNFKLRRQRDLSNNLKSLMFITVICSSDKTEANKYQILSNQFSSVAQSCPALWDPMNRSRPGRPVHHQLLEFTQTHVL